MQNGTLHHLWFKKKLVPELQRENLVLGTSCDTKLFARIYNLKVYSKKSDMFHVFQKWYILAIF